MKSQNNKLIIYEFNIQAISPVYFGDNKKGELIKDSKGEPVLFGNSIGGALRDYLEKCDVQEDTIYTYMGGNRDNEFLESLLYISDGKITGYNEIYCKEGTAIDSAYGSAGMHYKYTLEHLPEGSIITFQIEYEAEDHSGEREFNKIIGTWVQGFRAGDIKLGGQQNNGFGKFKIIKLEKKEFIFRTQADLDNYIFKPNEASLKPVNERELPCYEIAEKKQVTFTLKGEFPYGVYQAFADKKNSQLTGLQRLGDKYYLPATSFRGVMRNEVRILLSKFLSEEKIDPKLDELFGNQDYKGKILFSDVILEDCCPVKVKRFEKDKKAVYGEPIYIKMDRLTGGAFDGALKKQREIQGSAVFKCQLTLEQEGDNPFLFPLIYVLRRIGSGFVPLGGRTAVGLGEFIGRKVTLTGAIEEVIPTDNDLSTQQIKKMSAYYNSFGGWCNKCNI